MAIKWSWLLAIIRRPRRRSMLDMIATWEAEEGPIDPAHLEWADAVLDRQGVAR